MSHSYVFCNVFIQDPCVTFLCVLYCFYSGSMCHILMCFVMFLFRIHVSHSYVFCNVLFRIHVSHSCVVCNVFIQDPCVTFLCGL